MNIIIVGAGNIGFNLAEYFSVIGHHITVVDQDRLLCEQVNSKLDVFVVPGNGGGTAAQQAVQAALLQHAGMPFAQQPQALEIFGLPGWAGEDLQGLIPSGGPAPSGPVYAAARRFAALPAPARHAWLAAHLAALRSGRLTLGQLP